jgi:hypothetical protein
MQKAKNIRRKKATWLLQNYMSNTTWVDPNDSEVDKISKQEFRKMIIRIISEIKENMNQVPEWIIRKIKELKR